MKKGLFTGFLWILAFILTLVLAVFQRLTGPTYPLSGKESLKGNEIHYKLLRSFTELQPLPVQIKAPEGVTAWLNFKRYKTDDEWTEMEMKRQGDFLVSEIPGQPAAGKIEYSIRLEVNGESILLNKGRSIVARFRGEVPAWILIIHVIFMFLGIFFAVRTGMEALRKDGNYFRLAIWTLGLVFIGGLILGPIVQEYAFGSWWTGFPFGTDLTDNKTLLAFAFWLVALFLAKKNKWWVVAATVLMIAVYLIPHSVMGSELDYQSGKMKNKYESGF
ncbi:MAG TPA: hypothetical protein VK469_13120 [Candidatus Kapabacteria bacterium]|nr:hypothetical protein [Candidatus Kapabacteria bacterium]